ncbi:hypothetical protein [Polaromonas sp. DSR2-3-2]|uniref:hypothetical protein n=1 Tax=unclassified Polaromonas TaxID=2638319 RepID=UPI003CF8F7E7
MDPKPGAGHGPLAQPARKPPLPPANRNWNSAQTRYTRVGIRLLLEADSADR